MISVPEAGQLPRVLRPIRSSKEWMSSFGKHSGKPGRAFPDECRPFPNDLSSCPCRGMRGRSVHRRRRAFAQVPNRSVALCSPNPARTDSGGATAAAVRYCPGCRCQRHHTAQHRASRLCRRNQARSRRCDEKLSLRERLANMRGKLVDETLRNEAIHPAEQLALLVENDGGGNRADLQKITQAVLEVDGIRCPLV